MKEKISNTLRIVVLSLILSATIGYALADWAPPAGTPPFNNVPPPINVGPATQQKVGNLFLDNWLIANKAQTTSSTVGTPGCTPGPGCDSGKVLTTKDYVDARDAATLSSARSYSDNQTLSISGNNLSIFPGNSVTIPGDHLGDRNARNGRITNVVDPTGPQDAATKNYVDTRPGDHLGDRNARNGRITNVGTPTSSTDAATKGYVDSTSICFRVRWQDEDSETRTTSAEKCVGSGQQINFSTGGLDGLGKDAFIDTLWVRIP